MVLSKFLFVLIVLPLIVLPLLSVQFRASLGQLPDPTDIIRPLTYTDRPAGVEKIEYVGALKNQLIGGID
jgi:hypothetical protein